MELLPKTKSEFSSKEYWEKFFKKRGPKSFDWYGEYNEMCGILHKYMKPAEQILVIGCGNSRLSGDLYDVGYHGIVNIDISDTVIAQMTTQNKKKRPDMPFLKMDVTKMEFESGSYSVVFDKGTLDALMPDTDESIIVTVNKMFIEIDRVLRLGGRYMCVTLAQPHILEHILKYFSDLGWMIRICRVPDKQTDEPSDFYLPVFVIVFTKFKKMPNMKPITEVCNFDETVERVDGIESLEKSVQAMQQYGVIRQQLGAKSHVDENISLDLYNSSSLSPRYTLHVVDNTRRCKHKYAIFIVPEGREFEWMFCVREGQLILCRQAGYERLVIVTLHRDHTYLNGLDGVKAELSTKVLELAPPNRGKQQVPFLSVGDDINTRVICERGLSAVSGEYVVEDVDTDGSSYRRLFFLNNPSAIQSEIKLVNKGSKGGKKPDSQSLSLDYYRNVLGGLALLHNMPQLLDSRLDALLVGLGGGSLARYIHDHFSNVHLDVVELDPDVVRLATNWFGFTQTDRLKVIVADGLEHIDTVSKQDTKKHLIILDVDSKDLSIGMTCPPVAFVKPEFLRKVNSILHPNGLLVLNLVCRNKDVKRSVVSDIKSVFPHAYFQPQADENVNETVYVLPSARQDVININTAGQLPKEISKYLKHLQESLRGPKRKSRGSDVVMLTKTLDNLQLL